jgi:parallel beta-helix repeat protein
MKTIPHIRTKLEAGVLIGILLLLCINQVLPAADTGSTDTMITNSLGHSYTVTFANLQHAVWELNSTNGGWVQVPPCQLIFPKTLYLISNLVFKGAGNTTQFKLGSNVNKNMTALNGLTQVTIQNMRFDVNNVSQSTTAENLSAIYMDDWCSYITIDHCSFYRGHGSFIFDNWYRPASYVTVENSQFHKRQRQYWAAAISFAGTYSTARNNFIEDTYSIGIRIVGSHYNDFLAEHDIIDGNYITGEIGHGIHMEFAANCTIINNIIYDLNSTAFHGYDGANAYSSGILMTTGTLCENNMVDHVNYRGIGSQGNCTVVNNYVKDVESVVGILASAGDIVSNNIVTGGLYIPSVGIKSRGSATITNNIVTATGTKKYSIGINANTGSNVVSDNTVSNALVGIRLDANTNSSVDSNRIQNAPGVGLLASQSDHCTVTGNTLTNVTKGIQLYKTHNSTVFSNILSTTSPVAKSSIYEELAPCNYNQIFGNNINGCKVKNIITIGANTSYGFNVGYTPIRLPITPPPTQPVAGSCWFNSTTGKLGIYDGSHWIWK